MKEYYNNSRVIAHLTDLSNEESITQELNLITYPFDSQGEANQYTKDQIEQWIKENSLRKFNTKVELFYWTAI
jgi:hypothetical protein